MCEGAGRTPHFSSLDAGQYRGLKCVRGDEKAAKCVREQPEEPEGGREGSRREGGSDFH